MDLVPELSVGNIQTLQLLLPNFLRQIYQSRFLYQIMALFLIQLLIGFVKILEFGHVGEVSLLILSTTLDFWRTFIQPRIVKQNTQILPSSYLEIQHLLQEISAALRNVVIEVQAVVFEFTIHKLLQLKWVPVMQ